MAEDMPAMVKMTQLKQINLYVCSGCQACDRAATFLRGWVNGRHNFHLKIISIARHPEHVVLYGITHTPALVAGGSLLGQNLTIQQISDVLPTYLEGI